MSLMQQGMGICESNTVSYGSQMQVTTTTALRAAISTVRTLEDSQPGRRILSEKTIESLEPSGSQEQDSQYHEIPLSLQAKAYMDIMIQATVTSMVQSMRQYMDQQFEMINRRFAQLEQANMGSNEINSDSQNSTSTQHIHNRTQETTRIASSGSNVDINKKQERTSCVKLKATLRKFPAIDYSEIKLTPA
ncbi:19514_t:CDS:2, partial [Racocetra fulgida]